MRAIVLADERSPRVINGSGHSKALAKVGGIPLVIRNLRTLEAAGVPEALVVTGYHADKVREALESYHYGIPVTVVHNSEWRLGSAHSIVAAAGWIGDQALLVPSDHLYPPSLIRHIMRSPAPAGSVILAVDHRRDEVFDEEECIKVRLRGDSVVELGMTVDSADGVCPGIVRIGYHLVETLRRLLQDVEISLVDSLRAMARRGRLRTIDVGNARWISISSPQARRYADLLLKIHGDTLETSNDSEPALLMNPGPVTTTPRVKAAVGARDMCHREPVFSHLLDSVRRKLGAVFGADDDCDVLVLTASGTGGMESAISTFAPRDGSLLVLRNGAFGDRLGEIAKTHGIETVEVSLPWGEPLPLDDLERILDEHPRIGAVGMIHHETSIGVLNDVGRVGAVTRERGLTLIVDAVSSLGAEDLDVTRDCIDVCVTSANKCLHAFSGLASICIHRDAWRSIEADPPRSYYLDLRRYRDFLNRRCQTPFTPAVNTMMSLNAALDELLEGGLEARREHYRRLCDRIRRGLSSLGLELIVDEERSSHSLTIVRVPEGVTYQEIYLGLKDRGFVVYESKGELAGKTFQVANMGALEEAHVDEFLAAMGQVLAEARARLPRAAGNGLRIV